MLEDTKDINLKLEKYKELLGQMDEADSRRKWVGELIEQLQSLEEENIRLKKTILRISAKNSPRMSSKLKDALYE